MTRPFYPLLLTGIVLAATPSAFAQTSPQQEGGTSANDSEEEIVVVGQKPRGAAVGDILPEQQYDAGDVRAMGVSSIADLITELAPQTTSGRGGAPLVLLEGRRVSSQREIASIPTEAIARVDVLPEEVALKYGYPADQKVLNIVLRKRFRAFVGEGKGTFATAGGGAKREGQGDFLSIRNGKRFNITAQYIDFAPLHETQRGLTDPLRTLKPNENKLTLNASYAQPLGQRVTGTLTGEVNTEWTKSLLGAYAAGQPLTRTDNDLDGHLGATVNADGRGWTGTWTATYDRSENKAISLQPLGQAGPPANIGRSRSDVLASDLTFNTSLYRLPAGDLSLTARGGVSASRFRSDTIRAIFVPPGRLSRTAGIGALNIDVPVLDSPSRWIGDLSINGNVEVQTLSDFSSVRTYGYGLNWRPSKTVSLIASFSDEQTAATVQQLGDPQIVTPLVRQFDYQSGQTVLVTRTSGGNPNLLKEDARLWHIGFRVKPFAKPDVSLSIDYNHADTANAIGALPPATLASIQAFPGRYSFSGGTLTAVDATPVNIANRRSETLRWGINFTQTLKTPQSQIDAMRAEMAKRFPNGFPGGGGRGPGAGAGAGPRGPGGGFGGMRSGGGRGGRITFNLYHTWHLTEQATLAPGLPSIDLLDGGTLGTGTGAQPRHEVTAEAGVSQSGLGARLYATWQSGSHVRDPGGSPNGDLRFDSLTKFNLRLFADLGQIPGLAKAHGWTRGMRVFVGVTNIFNTRQRVTDGNGTTPLAYNPVLLDPLGRTVSISVRKLFF